MGLMFLVLAVALANLQLRDGTVYGESAKNKKTKGIYVRGDRGMITDINSVIYAQDKRIYNVCFYRDPTWNPGVDTSGSKISAYGRYTDAVVSVLEIVKRHGCEAVDDFALRYDPSLLDMPWDEDPERPCNADNPYKGWYFEWGNVTEIQQKLREKQWRDNFFVKDVSPDQIFVRLCDRYKIPGTSGWETLTPNQKAEIVNRNSQILAVWQLMQMNAFVSMPIVIAYNVTWEAVMEIETRSMMLDGITIAVSSQRVYPNGTQLAHVIGYIGKIQSVDQYRSQLKDKGYRMDDLIGLDGIEKTMEDWLTPNSSLRQGKRVVEIDRYGAVSRELENTPPMDGCNVKLTINSQLQRIAEMALEENINIVRQEQETRYGSPDWNDTHKDIWNDRDRDQNPVKFAEKGAVIAIDMQGRVLALASYPPYDPNAFIAGGAAVDTIMDDPRNPLMNYAIQSLATPGSIFKMVTGSAALATGELKPEERISDGGPFTKYEKTRAPRCWIDPRLIGRHRDQTIVDGLQHSCNYFFYEISSRMGSDTLYKYASLFGLTSKTNIDLPGEQQSYVGNQAMLFDPTKAISPAEQATWRPTLVKNAIKRHIQRVGRERNITYDESKLDRAIKRLMEMAVVQNQSTWVRNIRSVLMEELDMSREMVYLRVVVGDIYIMLNEIRWGGSETIMVGIGQSITQLTPAAVARYVAAVANNGVVYDLTLIDSITSPEGEIISRREPVVSNTLPEIAPYLHYIREGMAGVVDEGGTAERYFRDFPYKNEQTGKNDLAGKTGTAQVSRIDLENNAWFVAFAPYEVPEIAVVCYIPNGYGGGYASYAARQVIQYYLDHRVEGSADLMPAANSLAY